MKQKYEIGQLVTITEGFPFEGEIFKIVGDKQNPWKKASPYSFASVSVKDGKDYIILMRQKDGTFANEQHVSENEIQLMQ